MENKLHINRLQLSSATRLTLSDRRLFNYLLLHAYEELLTKKTFSIDLNELQGVYGSGLPPIDRLKGSIGRLTNTLIETETNPHLWMMTSLFNQTELDEDTKQLRYSFSPLCCQLFSDPITLEYCLIQAHFIHKYSSLLYYILASAYYSNQTSYVIEIEELRDRLKLMRTTFKNFGDFDRFALKPSLDEINVHASFATKVNTIRQGMKVTKVVFTFTQKRIIPSLQGKSIIPPKRPRLFIEDPETERVYAFLLNTDTHARQKYFNLAQKKAAKNHKIISNEQLDTPDLWFNWVKEELIKNK